jgi:hypothetical protein
MSSAALPGPSVVQSERTPIPVDRLAAPAQRALSGAGFATLEQLADVRESDLADLHGLGPSALRTLRQVLSEHQLSFATED